MSRLEEIFNKTISEYNENTSDINKFKFSQREKDIFKGMIRRYATEVAQASLEKAKKDLYNYWIFFEEGKTNSPEFTIKVEDPAKVYNTAYEAYGPQVQDLFYSCVSHEESITNPENIVLL